MPRKGYRAVSLEEVSTTYVGELRRKASALLGKDLTLSDAAGIASLIALQASREQLSTALDVFIEFRTNSRANRR